MLALGMAWMLVIRRAYYAPSVSSVFSIVLGEILDAESNLLVTYFTVALIVF